MVCVPSPNYLKVGKGDSCIQSVNSCMTGCMTGCMRLDDWLDDWLVWGFGVGSRGILLLLCLLPLLLALAFFLRLASPLPVFLTILPNKPLDIQILVLGVCFWGNQCQGAIETTIHSTISRVPNPGFTASFRSPSGGSCTS